MVGLYVGLLILHTSIVHTSAKWCWHHLYVGLFVLHTFIVHTSAQWCWQHPSLCWLAQSKLASALLKDALASPVLCPLHTAVNCSAQIVVNIIVHQHSTNSALA